jgi:hypothetical protein
MTYISRFQLLAIMGFRNTGLRFLGEEIADLVCLFVRAQAEEDHCRFLKLKRNQQ